MERDVFIPWYTPTQGIIVTTDSDAWSSEIAKLQFYDKDGNYAGYVYIIFKDNIRYSLGYCKRFVSFSTLPTEKQKTWIISYDYTKQRVVIHCNEVEVVNVLLSDGECYKEYKDTTKEYKDTTWRNYWEKPTTQIKFSSIADDASDSYCISGNPGKQFTWGILGSVT